MIDSLDMTSAVYCKSADSIEKLILSFGDYLHHNFGEYDFICLKHQFAPEPYLLVPTSKKAHIKFENFITACKSSSLKELQKDWTIIPIVNQNDFPDYLYISPALSSSLFRHVEKEVQLFQNIYSGWINTIESSEKKSRNSCANLVSHLTHDMNSMITYLQDIELSTSLERKISFVDVLIPKLLLYVRELDLSCTRININDLIKGIMDINSPDRIRFIPAVKEMYISCDVELINNALTAIINNALQAATDSDSKIDLESEIIKSHSLFYNNYWAKISIVDQFSGISDDFLPMVFKPFFTTWKDKGHAGLGLSMARKIIKAHRGQIQLNNNASGGLTVVIYLPVEK